MLRQSQRVAQGLPAYVSARDGGIRAIYDGFYGSWNTNWTLASLEERGVFRRGGVARRPG